MHLTPHLAITTSLALLGAACGRPVELQTGPRPCVTDTDCAAGGSCATNADCPPGTMCNLDGTCVETCGTFTRTCVPLEPCMIDTDCPVGLTCAGGVCVTAGPPGCRSDGDCTGGTVCDTGTGTCK